MIPEYTKAVASLQELFQELSEQGNINQAQAIQFDEAQKVLINFHEWTKNQITGNFKVELPWNDERFTEAWKLWKNFKKEKGFTYKIIGEQSALHRLTELSGGDMNKAIAILKQSRENGWSGLFELKENQTTKKVINQAQNTDYKQSLFNRLTQQQ